MVGGKEYKATVVVAMQQDPSLSVTLVATIKTLRSDVVAMIRGSRTTTGEWDENIMKYILPLKRKREERKALGRYLRLLIYDNDIILKFVFWPMGQFQISKYAC